MSTKTQSVGEQVCTKTLKGIASGIKVQWHRLAFNPETEQTDWIATIGNERFEYHTGLKACVPERDWQLLCRKFSTAHTHPSSNADGRTGG